MIHSSTDGSASRSGKIDRVRNLLAFDLSFPSAVRRDQNTDLLAADQDFPAPSASSSDGNGDLALGKRLVGFDEAGRGSLAGPVTVACVSFELSQWITPAGELNESVLETYCDLNDSKRVTERNRERLYTHILAEGHWGIGCASAIEIDRFGIVKACSIAADRAYRCLGHLLGIGSGHGPGFAPQVDYGLFDRGLSLGEGEGAKSITSSVQLTHGDAKSFHIAAASILAKVRRDAIMRGLEKQSEVYGFARHKGYGTAAHFAAIEKHGPSRLHRRTFLSRVGRSKR